MQILGPFGGLVFLIVYGAAMVALTAWFGRGHKKDQEEFLLASRGIGVVPGAMSIAASWIWAPALFVAAQIAYEQGIPGLLWFTVPNVLSLVVFAPLAFRIRKVLPAGYTLPEFMRARHGRAVHILYIIQFFGLQICSFAVQILAGSVLIQTMTGLSFHLIAVALVLIALSYSVMGGVRASVVTDFVQMGLILTVALITAPWAVINAGGVSAVTAGLGGIDGTFKNPFDPWVAYSFGIPVTIGLLSGPIGDQMHWQRAFALRADKDVIKTFMLGAGIFLIVPLTLSLLGFVAANESISADWTIESNQLIGPITVAHLLPQFMLVVFSVMLLSGLCSTLDSILCAASALTTVDLGGLSSRDNDKDDVSKVSSARIGMLATAAVGLGIACIPGLQIVHLFLFYGTWRASTMIPTILSLFWSRLNSNAVFAAILTSLLLGAPIYAAGAIFQNPHLSVAGSLLVVLIGFGVCVGWSKMYPPEQPANRGLTEELPVSLD